MLTSNTAQSPFLPERDVPPLPVLVAFGYHPLHQCRAVGSWDLDKAMEDMKDSLQRSTRIHFSRHQKQMFKEFVARMGERAFLAGHGTRVYGYASSAEEALRIVTEFIERYALPDPASAGSFELIKNEPGGIYCENVPLSENSVMTVEALDSNYPAGTAVWHKRLEGKLLSIKKGLLILEGEPGTGKTSYLRHLMGSLRDSHRFYFIPPSSLSVLSHPKFIGFWADERKSHEGKKLAVILEDADAALMTRGSDNREEVSAILNLTDGMLGDFLGLQIICTMNCRISEIDQALLRPGRLITHRRFDRLDAQQARELAGSLGKTLPVQKDYSLAEVFAGEELQSVNRPRMGFGV
jgi:energy-coupling factor transporter ATP-binding protein EcfA2